MFALLDCSELPLRPEPGRPWTTSPSPWTAGTACGCTWPPTAWAGLPTVALAQGARPRTPRSASHCPPFEFPPKPENRQGLGVGHGQPQAVAHPRHRRTRARNPSGWVTRQQGPGARRRARGAAQGAGACRPTPGSALGAGRRPGGCLYSAPWGADIGIPARALRRYRR